MRKKEKFLVGLLDIGDRDGLLACAPDCVEAAGLVNLHALARSLAERVRVLGEVRTTLDDAEIAALADTLATAAITAARLVHTVARRMNEEAGHADD